MTPSRVVLGFALTGLLLLGPARAMAQGTPSAPAGQKEWQDRDEYDLYDSILKDTNAATKLQKLDQWKAKYPKTAFIEERRMLYLTTYATLIRAADAVAAANEILANNSKDFTAQYYVMYFTRALGANGAPSPEVLDQGEKAANSILANINTPPPNVTEDQWKSARKDVEALDHTTLGWIAMQRKNWTAAEDEFKKALDINPNSGDVDYQLATVLYSQKNEKLPIALFYFARAAAYDGPNSLTPDGRKQVMDYVRKAYNTYHGSAEGFDQLLQLAKSSTAPPAGFKIVSAAEIAAAKEKEQAEKIKSNPQLAMWNSIKDALVAPEGQTYFNDKMKDALLPEFTGKVVSIEPGIKPKTVVLAISDGTTPDATLKFETALPGKVEPGTVLTFQGVPVSYSANPFMVIFNADKEHLKGWTGTGAAAPKKPAPRRSTRKR